jgi:hypothetical protein
MNRDFLAKFIMDNFDFVPNDEYCDGAYIIDDLKSYKIKRADIPRSDIDRQRWANDFVSNANNANFLATLIKESIDRIYYDCVDADWKKA